MSSKQRGKAPVKGRNKRSIPEVSQDDRQPWYYLKKLKGKYSVSNWQKMVDERKLGVRFVEVTEAIVPSAGELLIVPSAGELLVLPEAQRGAVVVTEKYPIACIQGWDVVETEDYRLSMDPASTVEPPLMPAAPLAVSSAGTAGKGAAGRSGAASDDEEDEEENLSKGLGWAKYNALKPHKACENVNKVLCDHIEEITKRWDILCEYCQRRSKLFVLKPLCQF